jgi:hypothetical protein
MVAVAGKPYILVRQRLRIMHAFSLGETDFMSYRQVRGIPLLAYKKLCRLEQ